MPNQHHRLADPVQWMVDGFLPLDFLFAEALDDVEQLRVGVGHGHCERGGGDGDAAHRLVEGEARPEAPLVFGQVGGWPMRLAPRDGAPVVSGRSADPRHEAHQHEVRELDDVRHGDRIRKFYADRGGALHEFEMVVGEDWVKAGEVPQFGLQIRSVGQEITKRIAGEASPQPLFEAKKRPVTRAAAVRALASFSSEIQFGGQPGFLENDAARSWPGAQLSCLSFDHGPDAFARGRSGPHRNHPLTQAGGFRPDFLLFPAAL